MTATAQEMAVEAAKARAVELEENVVVSAFQRDNGSTEFFIMPEDIAKPEFVVYTAPFPAPANEFDE